MLIPVPDFGGDNVAATSWFTRLFERGGFVSSQGWVEDPTATLVNYAIDPFTRLPLEPVLGGTLTSDPNLPFEVGGASGTIMGQLPPGTDLRDVAPQSGGLSLPGGLDLGDLTMPASVAAALLPAVFGGPLGVLFSAVAVPSILAWEHLPGWLQTALVAVGVAVGTKLVVDKVFPRLGGGQVLTGGQLAAGVASGSSPGGLPSAVVGSWRANGVVFYRLADGRLAVQNKMGRWKVWRPKRPIVLMPTGATSLKTLLRADAVLNRQAKKIAKMLNRQGYGSSRRAVRKAEKVVVLSPAGNELRRLEG